MKITELNPKVVLKSEFHLSKVKFVPERFGCYALTNYSNDIMYIGQTNNLKSRMIQHLKNSKKTKLTDLGVTYYFHYKIVEKESELNKLERGWLNHFELAEGKIPVLNSVHGPI